jgi:DNA (cytosine-5)-methyltransferase 1
LNYIELFAGCGGLSLGLEASGHNLVIANELSPMAAETFAYNFFNESLDEKATKHTLWINSNFPKHEMSKRLRENPRTYPSIVDGGFSDLDQNTQLNKKLLVGSIVELNKLLQQQPELLRQIQDQHLEGGLDLVSGGPPCQSFSMAGLRQLGNERNTLPWEFAKFVELTNPKFVLLENVSGILRAFNTEAGQFYAWYEVAKAFSKINYVPLCLHVNAKYTGVAQNRPRFILLGVRADVYANIIQKLNKKEQDILKHSYQFFEKVQLNTDLEYGHLKYFDVDKDTTFFHGTFLEPLIAYKGQEFSVADAIQDLSIENHQPRSKYVKKLDTLFNPLLNKHKSLNNYDLRTNGAHVKKRFKLYQNLNLVSSSTKKEVQQILKGLTLLLSDNAFDELKNLTFLNEEGQSINFSNKPEFVQYLQAHQTKKQTQKALVAHQPAPAALSIPDDACHYCDLRTLTVREMARVQSFPDNFKFLSKVTTGGQMRKFEVPQYTQVGNAVPPLLGFALGSVVKYLIDLQ